MKFAMVAATCLPLVVVAGCSMGGGPVRVADASSPKQVPVVDSIPLDGRVISDINIVLCQATAADKPHTADEALRSLKITAAQKGASGISNVTSSVVTKPTVNCYSMAQATGIAYVQG